jgi:hypothetical protein
MLRITFLSRGDTADVTIANGRQSGHWWRNWIKPSGHWDGRNEHNCCSNMPYALIPISSIFIGRIRVGNQSAAGSFRETERSQLRLAANRIDQSLAETAPTLAYNTTFQIQWTLTATHTYPDCFLIDLCCFCHQLSDFCVVIFMHFMWEISATGLTTKSNRQSDCRRLRPLAPEFIRTRGHACLASSTSILILQIHHTKICRYVASSSSSFRIILFLFVHHDELLSVHHQRQPITTFEQSLTCYHVICSTVPITTIKRIILHFFSQKIATIYIHFIVVCVTVWSILVVFGKFFLIIRSIYSKQQLYLHTLFMLKK